ncbi:MAG: hypothetical protein IT342_05730 [Candidatus Melainabacteria bacterium]|nr:hypothetical protein [Candidatus Melainabacteria bacterium]
MKLRRRRGATLGLVAVIVLFIAILGIGFFFLSKIMGGGREVANATDAGAMNVAKRALMEPTVNAPANDEFDGLGVDTATGIPNNTGTINLLAYNRAAGRALLVALNARAIGPASSALAGSVIDKLETLGRNLQNQLNGGGLLPGYFDNMAAAQNVKMMGPTSDVKLSMNIQPAWMIHQDANNTQKTNVYIDESVISMMGNPTVTSLYQATTVVSPNGIKSKGSWPQGAFSSKRDHNFVRAYDRNMTLSNYLDKAILGAAVGPQDRAHLVHLGQFDNCATAVGYAPPNSWKTQSQSQNTNKNQGNFGGAVACAVVGSLNAEYEACIPRGYVRILNYVSAANLPGAVPVSGQDINGGTSIFNNEFWNGTGGTGPTSYAAGGKLFADRNGAGELARYQQYVSNLNRSLANTPPPPAAGARDQIGGLVSDHFPGFGGTTAEMSDMTGIRTNDPAPAPNQFATKAQVISLLEGGGRTGSCDQNNFASDSDGATAADLFCRASNDGGSGFVSDASVNFGRGIPPGSGGANAAEGMNGIEYLKARVVEAFGAGARCARNVTVAGDKKAGMKTYTRAREGNIAYNTPAVDVQFANVGSPYELLMHTMRSGTNGFCSGPNDVIGFIHQRCKEILPTVDRAEVETLMKSQDLPPGATMFIFLPPGSNRLAMQPTVPRTHAGAEDPFNLRAEGSMPNVCASTPDGQIRNVSVNAKDNVEGNSHGDTGIHDQPYTQFKGTDFQSTDIVEWKPSCGAHNFLGELSFRNETTGGGEFCKPN